MTVQVFFDAGRDDILDQEITNRLQGNYPDYQIQGEFIIGEHALVVNTEDGCKNTASFRIPFEVTDCIVPSPICRSGITAVLGALPENTDVDGDGAFDRASATVWASDFIASPTNECSGPVLYSINRIGATPNPLQDSLLLTCKDSTTTIEVEIHAWDAFGNNAFCTSTVDVQDNGFGLCESFAGAITGSIKSPTDLSIPDVEINLFDGTDTSKIVTGNNGLFEFPELRENMNYTVTPFLDTDHSNGVTTFDLVGISRHILGIQVLGSPYLMIAADVNNSRTITTVDLILIRRLVLRVDPRFNNNTSWRFIDADYEFPVAENPWFEPFPESITIENLAGTAKDIDFVAVKIGDVNNSAIPSIGAPPIEVRSEHEPLLIHANEVQSTQSEVTSMVFTAGNLNNYEGFQFTLDYGDLELQGIQYHLLKDFNLGRHDERSALTISWNGKELNPDTKLFTLDFKSIPGKKVAEAIMITSQLTPAEAYPVQAAGQFSDVSLQVLQDHSSDVVQLGQNYPNPAVDHTYIPFYISQPSEVQLLVYDVNGKVMTSMVQQFDRGDHTILVDCADWPAGVFTYQLEPRYGKKARKMVKR